MIVIFFTSCSRNNSAGQNPAGNIPLIGGITGGIGKLFGWASYTTKQRLGTLSSECILIYLFCHIYYQTFKPAYFLWNGKSVARIISRKSIFLPQASRRTIFLLVLPLDLLFNFYDIWRAIAKDSFVGKML